MGRVLPIALDVSRRHLTTLQRGDSLQLMSRLIRFHTIACLLLLCALAAPAAGARSAVDPCCAGMGDPCAAEDAPCASLNEAPCCSVAPASIPTPQQRESGQQTQAPAIATALALPAPSGVGAAPAPQLPVRTSLVRRSDVLRL